VILVEVIVKLISRFQSYFIFIIGGGIGALVNWLISFLLTSIIGIHYVISYSIAQTANIAVNFLWHRFITFRVKDKSTARFIRFFIMSIITALISIVLVYLTKEFVLDYFYTIILYGKDLNYLAAIIIITFVISVMNYLISKLWVFKE
jgi:putative flippase GtrA